VLTKDKVTHCFSSVSLVWPSVWVSAGFCQSMARNLTVQEAAAAAAVASMSLAASCYADAVTIVMVLGLLSDMRMTSTNGTTVFMSTVIHFGYGLRFCFAKTNLLKLENLQNINKHMKDRYPAVLTQQMQCLTRRRLKMLVSSVGCVVCI